MSRPLISADDVRAARQRRETRLAVPADALVTPLARDEAARWGIELVEADDPAGGGSSTGRGGSPPGRDRAAPSAPSKGSRAHVPTCDDPGDPVEQIVARVMARVPEADPAQVREIARRVLESRGG